VSRIASRDPASVPLTARVSRSDLLWVANTAHGPAAHWHARPRGGEPDHDHLASPEGARRYLADHGVPIPDEPADAVALGELGIVRAMVERLVVLDDDPWTDAGRALLTTGDYALDSEGRIASTEAGWRGLSRDLLLPLVGLVADHVVLRRCGNPACRLLFEDGSRNRARRWCDTTGCGNRDRVGRARGRRQGAPQRASAAPARSM